jgi:sialic acid synthase SpsE
LPDEYLSGSIAYSMGARIFEKHVNIKTKKFKINKYSSTPEQLDNWLHFIDQTIIRIGSKESRNSFLKEEQKNLLDFKRGAFLKKGLYKKRGEKITIEDIAHALSNQCRFSGHVERFYSVAQHSVLVASFSKNKLAGLLHDASEAYLVDVPRPIKPEFPAYAEIEKNIMQVIAKKYDLI